MKRIKGRQISLIASVILLGLVGFDGCDSGSIPLLATTYNGISIDGPLKDATVSLNGISVKSNDSGHWTIPIVGNIPANAVVTTTGGIDTATGEKFEGKISAVVNGDSVSTVITPLTSLVVALVQKGLSNNAALEKIASQLAVPVTALTTNPIAALSSSNPVVVENAQKVIKDAFIVQKVAEAFAKSIVADAANPDFNKVTDAVFTDIAAKLYNGNTIENIVNDTGNISSNVASILKENLGFLSTHSNIEEKLLTASSVVKSISDTLKELDSTQINQVTLVKISKAIDIITSSTESKLVPIAYASTISAISAAKSNAVSIADAFALSGGVSSIVPYLEDTSKVSVVVESIISHINAGESADDISDMINSLMNKKGVNEAVVDITKSGNLESNGTVNDTALQVNTIENVAPTFNVFYIKSDSLIGSTYADIRNQLNNLLNIKLTAIDTTHSLNADYVLTVVIKNSNNSHFLAGSTKAHFEKLSGGDLKVTVPADNDLILQADTSDITATVTKNNAGANTVTSTTKGSDAVMNINIAKIVDEFSTNALIGDTIKKYLVNYTTNPGNYDVYLLINKASNGVSFISDTNSVIIDASAYDNHDNLDGLNYNSPQKAIQVHTTIN